MVSALQLSPPQVGESDFTIELVFSAPAQVTAVDLLYQGNIIQSDLPVSGSGTTWTVSITNLEAGEYTLRISKEDPANPTVTLNPDVVEFLYNPSIAGFALNVDALNRLRASGNVPETWFSVSEPYDVSFLSNEDAYCKYSTNGQTDPAQMVEFSVGGSPSSFVVNHQLTEQSWSEIDPLIAWCQSAENELTKRFIIGYESSPPSFNVTVYPLVVVDPTNRNVNFSIVPLGSGAPQKVYCGVTDEIGQTVGFSPPYDITQAAAYRTRPSANVLVAASFSQATSLDYDVTCYNRAGLSSKKTVSVGVNLQSNGSITLISPKQFTNKLSPPIKLQVQKSGVAILAKSCRFTDVTQGQFSSVGGINFTTTLQGLGQGSHSFGVECTLMDDSRVNNQISFTIDQKPPPTPGRVIPAFLCGEQPLYAEMTLPVDTIADPNFLGYNWSVSYSPYEQGDRILAFGLSEDDRIEANFSEIAQDSEFEWHIKPIDKAGNAGAEIGGTTQVVAPNDPRCDTTPPRLTTDIDSGVGSNIVSVFCEDDMSGCTETFQYGFFANVNVEQCSYDMVESYLKAGSPTPLRFFTDGTLCYRGLDQSGNDFEGRVELEVGDALAPSVVVYEPQDIVTTSSVRVLVGVESSGTQLLLESCAFIDGPTQSFSSSDGFTYTASISTPDGEQSRGVSCTTLTGQTYEGLVNFIKDTTPPSNHLLDAPEFICEGSPIKAIASHDYRYPIDPRFFGYHYKLSFDVDGGAVIAQDDSASGLFSVSDDSIQAGESYRWSVFAYDSAGNNGSTITQSTSVVATSDVRCDAAKPVTRVVESPQQIGVGISVNCTDGGSGCSDVFYFDFLPGESNPLACTYSKQRRYDAGPLTVVEDGLFCYRAADKQFNTVEGSKAINVQIDARLEILSPNSTYVKTQSVPFSAQVVVDSTPIESNYCTFVDGASGTWPSGNRLVHSTTANFPEGGQNKVTISCAVGGVFVTETINFTVDSQLPRNHELNVPQYRCSDQQLVATASHNDDYPIDLTFSNYEWILSVDVDGGAVLASGLSSDGQLMGPRGEIDKIYRWTVTAIDRAGNRGSQMVKSTSVLEPGSLQCDYTPPVGNALVSATPQGITVKVECSDDVSCRNTFVYDLLPQGSSQSSCTYGQSADLSETLTFHESGLFCFKVFDDNGNSDKNSKTITMPSISDPYIAVHSPRSYSNQAAVPITISVQVQGRNFPSQNCTFTDGATAEFTTADGVMFTTSLSGLNDDEHNRQVECMLAGGRRVAGIVSFIKDITPPKNYNLFTPEFVCENMPLRVEATHNDQYFLDPNFAGFEYLLTYNLPGASFENTDQSVREFVRDRSADGLISYSGSDLNSGENYKWQVRPYDYAGNLGDVMSGVTEMVSVSDNRCDATSPTGRVLVLPQELGFSVEVNCTDNGSGCTDAFSYSFLPGESNPSLCTYENQRRYDAGSITIFEQGLFCYRVSDQQLNTDEGSSIIEETNISVALDIIEPVDWSKTSDVTFVAQTTVSGVPYPAQSCEFVEGANGTLTQSGSAFSGTSSFIDGGPYSVEIGCFIAGSPVKESTTFSVDTSAPQNHKLSVPQVLCQGQDLVAKASHNSKFESDPNFIGYNYTLSYETGDVKLTSGISKDGELSADSGEIGERYEWVVVPIDAAGNTGDIMRGVTEVVAADDLDCDLASPIGTATVTEDGDAIIVSVSCSDDVGCSSDFSYDVLPLGSDASSCTYTQSGVIDEELRFFESGLFCFKVFDLSLNEGIGTTDLSATGALRPLECSNDELDLAIGETDVDCGGPCLACNAGSECLSNQDCSSGFCSDDLECEVSSCTDNRQNGYETDVDCGGLECPSCGTEAECSVDNDCGAGLCEAGECVNNLFPVEVDSDGDGMPDEWELDYGLDPNDPSDASQDPDNDGRSNYEEYLDKTNPNKADSPSDRVQQPLDSGLNWLALILVLCGVLFMGGSSYWLYYEHEEKEAQQRRSRMQSQQQMNRLRRPPTPGQRQNMASQRTAQMQNLKTQQDVSLRSRQRPTPSLPSRQVPPPKDQPGDEYIHIDDLKGKKKKESAAFKDLDKLLKEKGK